MQLNPTEDTDTIACSRNTEGPIHVPVGIDRVKNRLKFRVWLSFLNHRQVVAKGAQARLKLLVIKSSRFVLVKVPKNTKPKVTF